jgi:CubicO group peptidase (beta-lactamase class C family)
MNGSRIRGRAAALALGTLLLRAPGAPAQLRVDVDAVDAVFADISDTTVPGCVLGVVQNGRLVYGRGYGMANLELRIPMTTRSVLRTGSVSKQFTGAVVAIAAMDGHLDLDDPIRRWVPELPDYGTPLTIRHALHHTSGLRDYLTLMSLRGLRADDWYTVAELLDVQARQRELNFAPGSEYLYSNSGYVLLSEVVARATGTSFSDYADEVLFTPLGMTSSHFHDDHDHVVPDRADGYAPLADGGFRTSMTTLDMVGDGGVYTSIEDMVRWVTALNDDALRPGLSAILETRGVLTSGDTIPYALGQRHGEYRGLATIGHGGSFVGFRADVLRFPEKDVSIVTLCNRSDGRPSERGLRVADVVLAERLAPRATDAASGDRGAAEGVPAVPVDGADAYAGRYYSPELDVEYRIETDAAGLRVRAGAGIDQVLYRLQGDTLAAGPARGPGAFSPSLTFRFRRTDGAVTGFELDAGRVVHLRFERRTGTP